MDQECRLGFVQFVLGYNFRNRDILCEALQAAGTRIDGGIVRERRPVEGNRALAACGEKVLALVVTLDSRYKGETTAQMNQGIQTVLSAFRLAAICDERGLTQFINTHPGQQGEVPMKLKATAIEALVGAVCVDGNDDIGAVRKVMNNLRITGV